ncbi:MAG: prepilin-type N-terminal cleavage/methylation domain-containing protein [Candidatus Edwardsbacteria bacterium]
MYQSKCSPEKKFELVLRALRGESIANICRENQKGFSIVELLIALLLLGVLSTIGYSQYVKSSENAKEASIKANMHTVQLAGENFSTMAEGLYPGGINTTVAQVLAQIGIPSTNNSVIAGATRPPFPPEALIPVDFANPINPNNHAIRNGVAKKPFGCVYWQGFDTSGNSVGEGEAALSYKITGMGVYRPIAFILQSAKKTKN